VSTLAAQAEDLRARHFADLPLVLANVWDASSAAAVAAAGASAIATSSAAVAAGLGLADHEQMPAEVAFAAVKRVAGAVEVPVSADLEAGYGLAAPEFVERLLDAGAVGCNLEDSDHHGAGPLLDADRQADYIAQVHDAAAAAGVEIVNNARVDAVIRRVGSEQERLDETVRRAHLYLAAGATCVYPIGVSDEATTRNLVDRIDGPLNVWLRPDSPPLEALRQIGVARVSLAGSVHHRAMDFITGLTRDLLGLR
jgi:2-methylisocitrate lyase-like PEP mutase family enzyme